MDKEQAQLILKCIGDLNNNRVNTQLINDAYSLLPGWQQDVFQRAKIQALHRFQMFNMDIINQALNKTDIIIEQSPIVEKKGRTTTRPRPKTKTKTRK